MREQDYPEGVYDKFTIEVSLDRETGNYMIWCGEWKCELAGGKWPGAAVAKLVDEIAAHNRWEFEECK